ncbi:unnamed protein product [Symbiodinium necroappetens]|uniref:Uncharacterized protein n=1 Tax=Symbiodinium necroappetens TaxID=1628268 RepID=A0A812Y112_9DINO|nr:unnamed protein product [Symbiodinium necroappetens]
MHASARKVPLNCPAHLHASHRAYGHAREVEAFVDVNVLVWLLRASRIGTSLPCRRPVHKVPRPSAMPVKRTPPLGHWTGPRCSTQVLLKCSLLEDPSAEALRSGKLPNPDEFLKVHAPRPGGPFLPCMPPCLSKSSSKYWVTPWSCCLSQINRDEGVGASETIAVRDGPGGALLLKLELCPHRSFGKLSFIRDCNGELLGAMGTLEKHRPMESQRSSYAIYGKQQLSGCQAISVEGEMLYQWATVSRSPFTYNAKMRLEGHSKSDHAWTLSMRTGLPPPRWVVSNKKRGAAVVPRSVDKKLHEYLIAPGVDPGLVVCGTFAQLLAQDELLLD